MKLTNSLANVVIGWMASAILLSLTNPTLELRHWPHLLVGGLLIVAMVVSFTRQEAPDTPQPTIMMSGGPKSLRETLCMAQGAVGLVYAEREANPHITRLQRLIDQIDRHRPLGPDGKHGNLHTATCGCTDA